MFKTIVVGVDGSGAGDRALEQARSMAAESGARLVVVHVTELVGGKGGAYPASVDEPEIRDRVHHQVEAMRAESIAADYVQRTVQLGGPAQEIIAVAQDEGADLIVVGSRGHSVFTQIVLGSVPLRLLHVAHCPVLVVPPTHAA